MKVKALAFAGLVAVLGTGAAVGVAQQATPTEFGAQRERHPEMMKALRALENAKRDLSNAAHDFGGHRVKALEHTEAAIAEVKEALKYDKK